MKDIVIEEVTKYKVDGLLFDNIYQAESFVDKLNGISELVELWEKKKPHLDYNELEIVRGLVKYFVKNGWVDTETIINKLKEEIKNG